MTRPIRKLLILGGGTAGWLTASYLARRFNSARPDGVQITLIESSDIPIVGVGEGTFPTMRRTLKFLGASEADFMRSCSATFKQGISFVNWATGDDAYLHPFNLPEPTESGIDLLPYWLLGVGGERAFTDCVALQDKVVAAHRAPKRPTEPDFMGALNYAYHFDAGRFAAWLAGVGQCLGVTRLIGTVERVEHDEAGNISRLVSREHGALEADLYIDCSGFHAALIGQAMGSPFRDVDHVLFANRALAMQVPYADPNRHIASSTIATAHEAGWTWDIGLENRRGVGYVYSNRHTSDERAEEVLRAYIGPEADGLSARRLDFRLGFRERPWVKNCVAIGLSAGFLEPLESTGVVMIENAAEMVAELLPASVDGFERAADTFNRAYTERVSRAIDFLKMHYGLSRRPEAYWADNRDTAHWTDSLIDLVEQWRQRPPHNFDLYTLHQGYPVFSYQSVLYGMGFKTDMSGREAAFPHRDEALRAMNRIGGAAERAAQILPDHRALIEDLYARAANSSSASTLAARA